MKELLETQSYIKDIDDLIKNEEDINLVKKIIVYLTPSGETTDKISATVLPLSSTKNSSENKEIQKTLEEFVYLKPYLEFLKIKHSILRITKVTESEMCSTSEEGEGHTPDFLFETENDSFYVELVRAYEKEEKKYKAQIKKFFNNLDKCLKDKGLETYVRRISHYRPEFYNNSKANIHRGALFYKDLKEMINDLRKHSLLDNIHADCVKEAIAKHPFYREICKNINKKNQEVKKLDYVMENIKNYYQEKRISISNEPFINDQYLEGILERKKRFIIQKLNKKYADNEDIKQNLPNNTLLIVNPELSKEMINEEVFELCNHVSYDFLLFLNQEPDTKRNHFFSHVFFCLFSQKTKNKNNIHFFLFSRIGNFKWDLKHPKGIRNKVPLSLNLDKLVEQNPSQFIDILEDYLPENSSYWIKLLQGFINCKKKLEDSEVEKIFAFIEKALTRDNFEKVACGLTAKITDFIGPSRNYDSRNNQIHIKIASILRILIFRTPSQAPMCEYNLYKKKLPEDMAPSSQWFENSPLGKVLSVIPDFLYVIGRHQNILKNLQQLVREKILQKNRDLEYSFFAGQYLYKTCCFDQVFFDEHFASIFPRTDPLFIPTMSGYLLSPEDTPFEPLYDKLKKDKYYSLALQKMNEFSREAQESLCDHICRGYLHRFDSLVLENSLFKEMINAGNENPLWWNCLTFFEKYARDKEKLFFLPEGENVLTSIQQAIASHDNFEELNQKLICFINLIENLDLEGVQEKIKLILHSLKDIDEASTILQTGIKKTQDKRRLEILASFVIIILDKDPNEIYCPWEKEDFQQVLSKLRNTGLSAMADDIEKLRYKTLTISERV